MQEFDEGTEDLLTDMEPTAAPAEAGKRVANYIIDQLAFFGFAALIGLLAGALGGEAALQFIKSIEANILLNYLTSQLLYALFMGGQEALLAGKTFGKMVTGTRAVRRDGHRITTEQAFTRGLCRSIPFNTISALFNTPPLPWHDQLSHTLVVDERASGVQ